jgi:hypothetical protein
MEGVMEKYWVQFPQGQDPMLMDESQISERLVAGGPEFMVSKFNLSGGWQKPSDLGFCSHPEQQDLKGDNSLPPTQEDDTCSGSDVGQVVTLDLATDDDQRRGLESVSSLSENSFKGMPLSALGPAIAKLDEEAELCAAAFRKTATNAVAVVLQAGRALLAAKAKVSHGEWGTWLKHNVPALSHDRANRYMKVARQIPHVRNLKKIPTVNQLYLATGVIKAPSTVPRKMTSMPHLNSDTALEFCDLRRFESFREFIQQVKPRVTAGGMPHERITQLIAEIELILALLREIQAHLGKAETGPPSPPAPLSDGASRPARKRARPRHPSAQAPGPSTQPTTE